MDEASVTHPLRQGSPTSAVEVRVLGLKAQHRWLISGQEIAHGPRQHPQEAAVAWTTLILTACHPGRAGEGSATR